MARRRFPLYALCLVGIAVFAALGTWQVQRRAWKHALIAQVEARVHAPPAPPPPPATWPQIGPADAYRRLVLHGTFQQNADTRVRATTILGEGFWILTPLHTDDGGTVLVNRGFLPGPALDPRAVPAPPPAGPATITGLLRLSEPGGGFLRSNDPAANRWYSRDTAAIAAARHLGPVAPYFLDAEAAPGDPPWPRAGLTVLAFPDNHLVYALTWFSLALLLAGAMFHIWRGEHRSPGPPPAAEG